jgi:pyrroloquinoline quinone (PQQ) biosynthesis protein C
MEFQFAPESQRQFAPLFRIGVDENNVIQDPHEFHVALNAFNRNRLQPGTPVAHWETRLFIARAVAVAEGRFLELERRRIAPLAAKAPQEPGAFLAWYDELKQSGPGQYDPLFEFLATKATYEQMRWFVQQEFAGEAGFDDLVALAQLKMPEQAKLELARNYWDEMGRGKAHAMHGPMLHTLAEELSVTGTPDRELVWESLALANLLVGLAYNRHYAFHALGALGAIELTAPTRAERVVEGLERLGISGKASYYFKLHAAVDIVHSTNWNKEVLKPTVEKSPEVGVFIAEGALMRLNAGARTFDRYRAEFGIGGPKAYVE